MTVFSKNHFLFFILFCLPFIVVGQSSNIVFISPLKQGDVGPAVLALQKMLNSDPDTEVAKSGAGSPGFESDYFGSRTKLAVIKFQEKYAKEILVPSLLLKGTGYVGQKTIEKLNFLVSAFGGDVANNIIHKKIDVPSTPVAPVSNSLNTVNNANNNTKLPVISSVFPTKVRRGEKITITGENFTPTNNTVILGDGPVQRTFSNLSSEDGKTISFVYEPPRINTMTKEEILAIPYTYLKQIEDPLAKIGATIDDVVVPYKGINSESELKDMLSQNGHSFDEMYHYFHVIVYNKNGDNISKKALFYGLREFPFDKVASQVDSSFFSKLKNVAVDLINLFTTSAYAQSQKGGGYTTGIVIVCTCNGNLMTFQMDYSGGGSGLYVFSPGFRPNVGSGLVSGPWLGGFQQSAGTCEVGVRPYCASITGNTPQRPVGYAL